MFTWLSSENQGVCQPMCPETGKCINEMGSLCTLEHHPVIPYPVRPPE